MQHDRPTPQELAEAVREFLQEEILPILDDHRLKFRTLVAINGLGIADAGRYLERYAELTGVEVSEQELVAWEVFGNVKWATGCLTQSRRHFNGQERSVELAVLGRLAAEMEY